MTFRPPVTTLRPDRGWAVSPTLDPTAMADHCAECALPIIPGTLGRCDDEPGWLSYTTMFIAPQAASAVFGWVHSLVGSQLFCTHGWMPNMSVTLKMLIACFLVWPVLYHGLSRAREH